MDSTSTKSAPVITPQEQLQRVEQQIEELEAKAGDNADAMRQLHSLHSQVDKLKSQVGGNLSAWQRTELARHPNRPYTLDYIEHLCTDWSEVHGDRRFGDDPALLCGMAKFRDREILLIGNQKGRDTKQKVQRNFGMANPEGYRKALRAMKMAEKFGRPVVTLVDIPGAYPGLGAEERGQAEAIAVNLREMSRLRVPIVTVVTGEGGSGGALGTAVADRVFMLENSVYSVISPEGCASIMWRDATKKEIAAAAMKITARDLLNMNIIDGIIPEPAGGAHSDHGAATQAVGDYIERSLNQLSGMNVEAMLDARYNKFRRIAQFYRAVGATA
ncbi:MAG TPA: acetyl-CoA carboxylase carboxyltransferase subunit alpha [Terriglobales bacterium]